MKRRKQINEWIFRVREGYWCPHTLGVRRFSAWTPWRIADGMRKWRWCQCCGRTEWS